MIAVKGNQKTLLDRIQQTIQEIPATESYTGYEKIKGRREHRNVSLWEDCSRIPVGWHGIKRIIYLHSYGERNGKAYEEHHYYISSLEQSTAERFAFYIRQHWQIENNLHRALDVVFQEDTTKNSSNDVHKKFALLRRIAMNIFRINGFTGLKYTVESFINRINELFQLIKIRT